MKNEDLFEEELEKDIIGYCLYCKEEILVEEEYVVKNKDCYHLRCYNKITFMNDEDYGDIDDDVE